MSSEQKLYAAKLAECAGRPHDILFFLESSIEAGGLSKTGEINAFGESCHQICGKRVEGVGLLHQAMKAERRRGTPESAAATAELHRDYLHDSIAITDDLIRNLDDQILPNCSSSDRKVLCHTIAGDIYRQQAYMMRPMKGSGFITADNGFDQHHKWSKAEGHFKKAEKHVEKVHSKHDVESVDGTEIKAFYYNSYATFLYEKGDRTGAIQACDKFLGKHSDKEKTAMYLQIENNKRVWGGKVLVKNHEPPHSDVPARPS